MTSTRHRRCILATTLTLAAAWVGILHAHVDGTLIEVAEPVLRLLVVIGAISWLILSVTAPALETARVWLEIGRAMERDRTPQDVAELNATVVRIQNWRN